MTTRTEPALTGLTSLFSAKKLNHTQLVDSALEAFSKAETQMGDAINQIQLQIDDEQRAIQEAQKRVEEAGQSKDKLTRVLDRVRAFTA